MTKYTKTLDKLQLLIDLVEETETEETSDNELFEQHTIDVYGMMSTIRDFHTDRKKVDTDTERETLIAIMKSANKIWRIRNKIKSGEYSSVDYLNDAIKDYLTLGHKIAAIKYYRSEMRKMNGIEPSLKTSKEYVDVIETDMKKRGLL